MTDLKRVCKLISKLQHVIEELESRPDIDLHRHISQFYYMQKSTELQLLHDQLEQLMKKEAVTRERLIKNYIEVFGQWKTDKRWMNGYLSKNHENRIYIKSGRYRKSLK